MSSNGSSDISLSMGISGSDDVVAAVDSVGVKATESAAKVDTLGKAGAAAGSGIAAGAKPAAQSLNEVEAAEQKLEAALKRLETANGPRALTKASRDATLAMMEYRGAAESAGVATATMGAKVDGAKTALVGAAGKVALMREEMTALKTQGGFAAEGMESLGGRMGSVEGVLQLAKQTMGETGKSMAELGLGAVAVVAGLELAKKAAEGIKEAAKAAGDAWVGMATKQAEAANQSVLLANFQRAVAAGLKDVNGNLITTVQQYQSYIVETQHGAQATEAFAKAAAFVVPDSFTELAKKATDYGVTASNVYEDAKKAALSSGASITQANAEGERAVTRLALANKTSLDSIAASYREMGQAVPVQIQKGIKAIEDWNKAEKFRLAAIEEGKKGMESRLESETRIWEAQQKAIAQTKELVASAKQRNLSDKDVADGLEKIASAAGLTVPGLMKLIEANTASKDAMDAGREAVDKYTGTLSALRGALESSAEKMARMTAEVEKANAAYGKYTEGLQKAKDAQSAVVEAQNRFIDGNSRVETGVNGLSGSMDELAKAAAKGGDGLVHMEVIQTKMMEASEAAIKSLTAQSAAFDKLSKQAENKNLIDYAANMKEAFESGMMSLTSWNEQMTLAIRQMEELIMKNSGNPLAKQWREQADALIELQKSMNMGGGGTRPPKINL